MKRFLRLTAFALVASVASFSFRLDAKPPGTPTIADLVVASATNEEEPQFTLLLAALEYTGLTPLFAGNQPYTVFAPTDQAFLNLLEALQIEPAATAAETFDAVEALLGEGAVAKVLAFHVTRGVRLSQSVIGNKRILTLNGQSAITDGGTIEGATITGPDLRARNGVIHVIDAVIVPKL